MKKLLLPLLLLLVAPQILFSQTQSEELRKNTGTPSYMSFRDDCNMTHEQAIEYSKSLCAVENVGFTLKNQQTGKDGKTLYRYEQTIAGYPIEFTAWHIHEKNGKVMAVNGDIVDIQDFNAVFSLSENEALQAALNHIGAEFYMWMDESEEQNLKLILQDNDATYYPTGIKVITPVQPDIKTNELTTAYKFDIYSKKPHDRKMVYVDAQTGEILFDLPLIHFSDEIGTAYTVYSGEREINTYYNGTQYVLHDNTRGKGVKTFDLHRGTNYNAATDFFDDDNIWNNVNPQLDEYATDAHFATMSTYDYYLNIHDRNSIDGKGFSLISYVHYDVNYFNAFWNGYFMTYGDGNPSQGASPLTTIDICGHEITHGLTNYTSNLVYAYEPGALNESFSDIFGTATEFYAVPESASWIMGEKMGVPIRSMSNPKAYHCPNTYKGQYWVFGGEDNGGVHTNSGVLNYWFYLISEGGNGVNDNGDAYQVQGIGIEKAEQIAFKLLVEYLTPNSQYFDAFSYALIAADELYGDDFPEAVQTVGDAFYAVGVIREPYNSTVNFKASETKVKEGTNVQFTDLSIKKPSEWHWYFEGGTPPESTERNPKILYETPGHYGVKLVVTNELGIDSLYRQDYMIVTTLPKADFVADVTEIEEGESVSFTNLSINYPESYQWFFEGGTPQQSSKEHPVILYKKAGTYSVRLRAINEGGDNIMLKKDYITVTPKTAITEQDATENITVYPNPTDGQLTVETDNYPSLQSIEIFDMMGKLVFIVETHGRASLRQQPTTFTIDIFHLPAGIYFMRITTEEGTITKKIIKN
ncbi:MAG: M4 family metallopeptidase [Bacteroidales bacterium]|jgi:Zn-dependent metalloprotease|nr:M4 family metallopeptidase [Bacteroidales bacterium]